MKSDPIWQHFDAAFVKMGEAFAEMDKAFDALRDSGSDRNGEDLRSKAEGEASQSGGTK